MKNLKDLLKDFNFDNIQNLSKKEIYEKYKKLGRHINFTNSMKKNEMIDVVNQLSKYGKDKNNNYQEFIFADKVIKLNEEQIKIVRSPPNNHVRIIACAGSGKTTTILCRIKYLLDNWVLPEKILVLTFNVEAYHNLRRRINELLGFDPKVEIRTIDSYSAKLYYNYQHEIQKTTIKNIFLGEYSLFAEKILQLYGKIICNNYQYVFFDEFQDVNDIHFKILKHFANNGCYLTVIGDDNQNIYQWRGTNNMYIINFDNIFENTNTYTLVINYRSNQSIINAANQSISFNKNRVEKNMVPINNDIIIPNLILYKKQNVMFDEIIRQIVDLQNSKNFYLDQIVILSRTNVHLKLFEEYLSKYNSSNNKKIEFLSLITENGDSKPIIEKGKLTLTTIHRSKGLEWEAVFIIGLNDNLFPSKYNDSQANLEEERRLFYVAITRAKNYLYFYANIKELPLSKFIFEILDKIKYVNLTGKKKFSYYENIFWNKDDDDYTKKEFNLTEIIKSLKPSDFEIMRENNLLPNNGVIKNRIYDQNMKFDEDIKKNFLELDISIFYNKLITRKILQKKIIIDSATESIISSENLSEEEMEIYNQYNLKRVFEEYQYDKEQIQEYFQYENLKEKDKNIIEDIIDKLSEKSQKIEFIREFTYPPTFLKQLQNSYKKYTDNNKLNKDILNDIYYVSLCEKFCENRRRLIYKNVYPLFLNDYSKINGRIDNYSLELIENDVDCNIINNKFCQINNKFILINDKIFVIDKNNHSVIDIKYSESNFKIEWLVHMLMSLSLLFNNEHKNKYLINKIVIVNLLKGKTYELLLNNNYNYNNMYNFILELIKKLSDKNNNNNSEEDNINVNNLVMEKDNSSLVINKSIDIKIPMVLNLGNYMILDTETTNANINNADIIQLSYSLYNSNYGLIKKFNKYIKPQYDVISKDSYNVHKITHDYLEKKGEKFTEIINEFLIDLKSTKFIVGHNVKFDINVINMNIEKYGINLQNIFDGKIIECTGQMSRKYSPDNKMIKLENLYRLLFGREMLNAHNSKYDIKYTADCYFKMKNIRPDNINVMENGKVNLINIYEKLKIEINKNNIEYQHLIKLYENYKYK